MTHWSTVRRMSLAVHVTFVTVPFLAASVSALLFWRDLFQSWWLAVPMVTVIDVLALTGLALSIARIASPFVPLRHALPFVSIVPLGRELYILLAHNGPALAGGVALVVIAIFTWIAWQCFATIERLFIPPVEAARERTRERLSQVASELAQLTEADDMVREFVTVYQRQRAPRLVASARTPVESFAISEAPPVETKPLASLLSDSKTARVKRLATDRGVSESTAWRKVRSGEWTID